MVDSDSGQIAPCGMMPVVVFVVCALFVVAGDPTIATDLIGLSGVQMDSGERQVILIDPDKVGGDPQPQSVPERITYGDFGASQGWDGTVIWWKDGEMWRYDRGSYVRLETGQMDWPLRPVVEAPGRIGLFAFQGHFVARQMDHEYLGVELLYRPPGQLDPGRPSAYIGRARDDGMDRQPLAWLSNREILCRRVQTDPFGRVIGSELVVQPVVPEDALLPDERAIMADEEAYLNAAAASFGRVIAFQDYSTATKQFRLGIVTFPNRVVEWLTDPTPPWMPLGKSRVLQLEWSPDGRYLAAMTGGGTYLWDAKKHDWWRRPKSTAVSYHDSGLRWLDSNTLATFTSDLMGTSVSIFDLSRPGAPPCDGGHIYGFRTDCMFRVARPEK